MESVHTFFLKLAGLKHLSSKCLFEMVSVTLICTFRSKALFVKIFSNAEIDPLQEQLMDIQGLAKE